MYGENLKRLRHELRMTAQQFADNMGVSPVSINNYENSRRKPNYEFLELLVQVYDVNLNWLIAGKGNMFISQNKTDLNQIDEDKLKAYFDKWLAEKGLI